MSICWQQRTPWQDAIQRSHCVPTLLRPRSTSMSRARNASRTFSERPRPLIGVSVGAQRNGRVAGPPAAGMFGARAARTEAGPCRFAQRLMRADLIYLDRNRYGGSVALGCLIDGRLVFDIIDALGRACGPGATGRLHDGARSAGAMPVPLLCCCAGKRIASCTGRAHAVPSRYRRQTLCTQHGARSKDIRRCGAGRKTRTGDC